MQSSSNFHSDCFNHNALTISMRTREALKIHQRHGRIQLIWWSPWPECLPLCNIVSFSFSHIL